MITFTCTCGASYTVAEHLAGKSTNCRKCGQHLTVPKAPKKPNWLARAAVFLLMTNLATGAALVYAIKHGREATKDLVPESAVEPAASVAKARTAEPLAAPVDEPAKKERPRSPFGRFLEKPDEKEPPAAPPKPAPEPTERAAELVTWEPLSDEERINWRKTRRMIQEHVEKRITEKPLMSRALEVFDPVASADQKEKDRRQLLDRQAELRRQSKHWKYQYLIFSAKSRIWATVSLEERVGIGGISVVPWYGEKLPVHTDVKFKRDGITFTRVLLETAEDAEKRARELAATPGIACVAVVDLYSDEDPRLAWWCYDNGNAVQRLAAPPHVKYLESLKPYIHGLQTRSALELPLSAVTSGAP